MLELSPSNLHTESLPPPRPLTESVGINPKKKLVPTNLATTGTRFQALKRDDLPEYRKDLSIKCCYNLLLRILHAGWYESKRTKVTPNSSTKHREQTRQAVEEEEEEAAVNFTSPDGDDTVGSLQRRYLQQFDHYKPDHRL